MSLGFIARGVWIGRATTGFSRAAHLALVTDLVGYVCWDRPYTSWRKERKRGNLCRKVPDSGR